MPKAQFSHLGDQKVLCSVNSFSQKYFLQTGETLEKFLRARRPHPGPSVFLLPSSPTPSPELICLVSLPCPQPATSLSALPTLAAPLASTSLFWVVVVCRLSPQQALGGALGARTSPGRWLRPPLAETCHLPGPVDTHSSPFLPPLPGSELQTHSPRNQHSLPPHSSPERALPACHCGQGLWSLSGPLRAVLPCCPILE